VAILAALAHHLNSQAWSCQVETVTIAASRSSGLPGIEIFAVAAVVIGLVAWYLLLRGKHGRPH